MRSYAARCINREIDYEIYHDWINSPEWSDLVARLKIDRGFKCEKCGSYEDIQGHHKVYHWIMTPYEERTVEILCRGCHQTVHGILA